MAWIKNDRIGRLVVRIGFAAVLIGLTAAALAVVGLIIGAYLTAR